MARIRYFSDDFREFVPRNHGSEMSRSIPIELHETTTVIREVTPHFACPKVATFTEANAREKLKEDLKIYTPMTVEFVPTFEDAEKVVIRYESRADMRAPEHASIMQLRAAAANALKAALV